MLTETEKDKAAHSPFHARDGKTKAAIARREKKVFQLFTKEEKGFSCLLCLESKEASHAIGWEGVHAPASLDEEAALSSGQQGVKRGNSQRRGEEKVEVGKKLHGREKSLGAPEREEKLWRPRNEWPTR